MAGLLLSPAEARIVASMVEKSIATPQYYPMTPNAIMLAANQKSARHPVMNLSEGDTGATLNRLEEMGLCKRDDNAGRVPKWRHKFQHQLLLKPDQLAVLVTLMLRGPQTAAELRANAAGLGGPGEGAALADALNLLADRAQPLVAQLPRGAGQSAVRYVHLLCGEPAAEASEPFEADGVAAGLGPARTPGVLEQKVADLEQRLAQLEALVTRMRRDLGETT